MSKSDDTWLSTRNKTKIPVKPSSLKRRRSLVRPRSQTNGVSLTQNSPPPKQLFTATRQSTLSSFFNVKHTKIDDTNDLPSTSIQDQTDNDIGLYDDDALQDKDFAYTIAALNEHVDPEQKENTDILSGTNSNTCKEENTSRTLEKSSNTHGESLARGVKRLSPVEGLVDKTDFKRRKKDTNCKTNTCTLTDANGKDETERITDKICNTNFEISTPTDSMDNDKDEIYRVTDVMSLSLSAVRKGKSSDFPLVTADKLSNEGDTVEQTNNSDGCTKAEDCVYTNDVRKRNRHKVKTCDYTKSVFDRIRNLKETVDNEHTDQTKKTTSNTDTDYSLTLSEDTSSCDANINNSLVLNTQTLDTLSCTEIDLIDAENDTLGTLGSEAESISIDDCTELDLNETEGITGESLELCTQFTLTHSLPT